MKCHPLDISCYDANTYYEYIEFIAKNNQHMFKGVHGKNKVVRGFAVPGSFKCVVKSKLPDEPKSFYLRPRKGVPADDIP